MDINIYRKASPYIGLLLGLISMAFTVKLLIQFGSTGADKGLFALFGIAIQSAQIICLVMALYYMQRGKSGYAIPGFLLYILLFGLSIAGTIGSFSANSHETADKATKNDTNYNLMLSELDGLESEKSGNREQLQTAISSIDKQIAGLQVSIADYRKRFLIQNGVKPAEAKMAALQAQKADYIAQLQSGDGSGKADELRKNISEYKGVSGGESMFHRIGDFFGVEADAVKLTIWLCYGLALDLCSACLLCYGSSTLIDSALSQPKTRTAQHSSTGGGGYSTAQEIGPQDRPIGYLAVGSGGGVLGRVPASTVLARPVQDTVQVREKEPIRDTKQDTGQHKTAQAKPVRAAQQDSTQPASVSVLTDYIRALFAAGYPDGSLMGRRKVQDRISLTSTQADKIHVWLKKQGLIRVKGQKTFPCFEQTEMLEKVG